MYDRGGRYSENRIKRSSGSRLSALRYIIQRFVRLSFYSYLDFNITVSYELIALHFIPTYSFLKFLVWCVDFDSFEANRQQHSLIHVSITNILFS